MKSKVSRFVSTKKLVFNIVVKLPVSCLAVKKI